MKTSNTIEIRRPLEEVFAYLSNIENEGQWRPSIVDVKVTSGLPLRAGSTIRYVWKMMDQQIHLEARVTAFEANRGWTFESTSGSPVIGYVACEPSNEGTKVTLGGETDLPGLLKLFTPIMRGMMIRQANSDLQNLKRLLEG
jgi:uncharacterized membrane protein